MLNKTEAYAQIEAAEFNRVMKEYKKVIRELKRKAVKKHGPKARKWFGI